ncbi:MAG: 2-amino-4-hydroxy-6-hydroxymethyldihydropteridine diphosphokinase [Thermoleophilia bacterium]|nr:2-amino-4-hydroxy-6-hydroxymethyldihydropteridine diphosphokinase [Thermoleophilia bacterium]
MSAPLRYWLGLGTNLGDRGQALQRAVDWLGAHLVIEAASSVYETAPRDLLEQPPFLNAAVRARTALSPPEVLDLAKRLEAELGRRVRVRYGPREIDCDLLLWEGGSWSDELLALPHPRLAERRFALLPVIELDPELQLPDGRSLTSLERALDPAEQAASRYPESLFIAPLD